MPDAELLQLMGTDGEIWTRKFLDAMRNEAINHIDLSEDEDIILGWFANAIEAGVSSGYNRGRQHGLEEADSQKDSENTTLKGNAGPQESDFYSREQSLRMAVDLGSRMNWDDSATLRAAKKFERYVRTGNEEEVSG